jgi:hypothetical protein
MLTYAGNGNWDEGAKALAERCVKGGGGCEGGGGGGQGWTSARQIAGISGTHNFTGTKVHILTHLAGTKVPILTQREGLQGLQGLQGHMPAG